MTDQRDLEGDCRLYRVGWVTGVPGAPFAEPKQFTQTAFAVRDGIEVSFPAPSVVALHLNAAWRSAARAAARKSDIHWTTVPPWFPPFDRPGERPKVALEEASTPALFDFIEEVMQTVSSSFAALEAFCNLTLVECMTEPRMVKTKGEKRLMTAEEIERNVGTGEKLKRHVPQVMGVNSPACDSVLWGRYKHLNEVRDELIHFKRGNLASAASKQVLHTLAFSDPFEFPEAATAILERLHLTTRTLFAKSIDICEVRELFARFSLPSRGKVSSHSAHPQCEIEEVQFAADQTATPHVADPGPNCTSCHMAAFFSSERLQRRCSNAKSREAIWLVPQAGPQPDR